MYLRYGLDFIIHQHSLQHTTNYSTKKNKRKQYTAYNVRPNSWLITKIIHDLRGGTYLSFTDVLKRIFYYYWRKFWEESAQLYEHEHCCFG